MPRLQAFNLAKWLSENRHLMKPPVGNKLLFDGEFKVMVVAGPNSRTDYHVESGEEWFFQLEGSMVLKVVDGDSFYDIPIAEGETFCLPPQIPHSPQRLPNSIGIVVERRRQQGELDALQWYCQVEECRKLLYRKEFQCNDLVKDLPPIIADYYGDGDKRTCTKCGFIEEPPAPPKPPT